MPRTPCGLACSMLTICSSSGSAVAVLRRALLTSRLLQDPLNGRQRDPYPFGSVGRLVGNFVHRLVQLERGERTLTVPVGCRQHAVDTLHLQVTLEEPGPVVLLPCSAQLLHLGVG